MPFKSEKQRKYLFANEPEVAKKFSQDYNKGGVASMFRKKQADGTDPNYEGWKKIYETNPDLAALNDKHDEYLEKYTLEMSTSDAGEAGILGTEEANMEFVEADDGEEVMVDDRINLMAAAPEKQPFLSGDLSATTLFMNKGGKVPQLVRTNPDGSRPGYAGPNEPNDGQGVSAGPGDTGGEGGDNPTDKSDTQPGPDLESNREDYRTSQYTAPKAQVTTTVTSPRTNRVTGEKIPDYDITRDKRYSPKSKTGFGKKGKDTWHEAATKNINKNIRPGLTAGQVFGWGLTLISAGVVPAPPVVKTLASGYGAVKNVKSAINVIDTLTSKNPTPKDKKEPGTIKDAIKTAVKQKAKEKIAEELKMSVKQIDEITKIGINAWNSNIAESIKTKFTETFKSNKPPKQKKEVDINDEVTFTGGDNDGPNEVIIPVVPEFLEEKIIVEEPTSSLSNAATLDLIRNRQNRSRSFFNANSGGLAGLFKVKKQ